MVEWARTNAGVWALGRCGRTRIGTEGWEPAAPRCALPETVDASVAGVVDRLRLPTTTPELEGMDSRQLVDDRLEDGDYLLTFREGVEVLVRFDGPATLARKADVLEIGFDDAAPVTLGFREPAPDPPTVWVPPTPNGLARAISLSASAHLTDGPARSQPAFREHPPLVEFGEENIPEPLSDVAPDPGGREAVFRLPDEFAYPLVGAPLAYYLGAHVVVEDRPAPLLELTGYEHAFSPLPAFAEEAARALRRVLFADALARELRVEPPVDRSPLTEAGLDAGTLRSATPARRALWTIDCEELDDALPEWHLSAYLDPEPEHARALPHLLDRFALIYPASASGLSSRELLSKTLDDFYRANEVPSVRTVEPELGAGLLHAWLADEVPIDGFVSSATAHEHGLERDTGGRLSVDVVVNDQEMAAERSVADRYRERGGEFPVEVRTHDGLTTSELAAIFTSDTDFIHYVGHCERDGLECSDGYLDIASLESVGVRTFFLNACGSYHEGRALVEGGAVAGGVTLRKVLNEQAVTVGAAFARLLAHGFGIERALSLARRRIMMGKDYAVVGDGTYRLVPPCGHPAVLFADSVADGYKIRYEVFSADGAGRRYRDPFTDEARLYGETSMTQLDPDGLAAFCRGRALPVVLDGEFLWADDVAAELTA